jgi:hypothetical protein
VRARADDPPGTKIYAEQCARCHGARGEGSEDYKKPLVGDRSVAQLAKYIAKTMPDDDPGSVSQTDAELVAAFIHDAFYSPIAQARFKPARVELSHLTVRQYRNAVADVLGSFRGDPGSWDESRGLKAEYYKGRNFRGDNRALERVDPRVDFDFGVESPVKDKIEPHEFSMRWQGSVLAPDTGDYELIIRTDHAARLWLNSNKQPLIDAWVKSGNDTEYRAIIRLLGGHVYPLKLEFSKAKQGVDDSDKKKPPPPSKPAMIHLEWKPPHGVVQSISERYLTPNRFPESFVLTTPFPPDDRSLGYERGTSISKEWEQATTDAAIEVANFVISHLNTLAQTKDDAEDRAAKVRAFCHAFAERAFRRPLGDELKQVYVDRQFDQSRDLELAARRAVLLVLKSPRFCYLADSEPLDDYEVAERLAFALWDAPPDRTLLEAAAQQRLHTREQVREQADRMLVDLRAKAKLRGFLLQWLRADPPPEILKDPKAFAGFDAALFADMRTSLELFLDEVIRSDACDFRELLLREDVYVNDRMAKFFGIDLPEGADFQTVRLDEGRRAGVLTHPYVMSCLAYIETTSPIHRGVFLTRGVLGRVLRPPPEAFAPLAPDLHPSLTTRERVALQTSPEMCAGCHATINPLGYSLEHFDAAGRYRWEEKGKPIDAKGGYLDRAGQPREFEGARELALFLSQYEETHEAFVEQLFHHLVKQPVLAYGPDCLAELRDAFAAGDYNIRKLIAEIAIRTALRNIESRP